MQSKGAVREERELVLTTHLPEVMAMARKEGRGSMSRRSRASEAGLLENWSTLASGRKEKSGRVRDAAQRSQREGREGPTSLSLSVSLCLLEKGRKPARHLKGTFVCMGHLGG